MTTTPTLTQRPGGSGPGGGRPGGVVRKSAQDVAQLDEHPVPLGRITALFAPYRLQLMFVIALIVITSLIGLASPFLVKHLIDDAIPNQNVGLLLALVGAMIGIAVVSQVLGVLQTWISTLIGQRVMHDLRTRLFTHLQRMPLAFFTRTRSGEVQSRATNDINAMQSVVTDSATSIASNVTTAVGTAIAMSLLSWRLSLLSLVVLPPAIYLTRRVAKQRKKIQSKAQQTLADMQTQIEESLSINGVILAKTLGSGPTLSKRFTDSSTTLTGLEVQSQLAGRWRMGTMAIIFAIIPAVIYLVAGLPATSGGMTIGTMVAFVALQSQLFRPLMGVLNVGAQIVTSMALFSRIFEYLDMPVEIDNPANPVPIDPRSARGEIRFDHVSVTYDGSDRPALDDIDLVIPAGSTVAVVGATGSGKSTMASLVSRLQDPSSGVVRIDGHDLRDLELTTIADLVGVVSQESYLLHASVADNLRYARPDATDEEIIDAAKAAQVHDLIAALPEGYDTLVGSRGYRFSGGEKQRIALARTILRDPRILVLDEATSALDNSTERAVQRALDAASQDRTTFTIAHRLSTIRNADLIVVLDRGHIVERGSHEQLLLRGGHYASLWDAQLSAAA